MRKKINTEKKSAFSLQLGKDIMSLVDSKSPIGNLFAEIGMTDWEIHMNQTMHFRDNNIKQVLLAEKKIVEKTELKNTRQYSDYWLG